jgi:hypothetical protein
VAQRELGRRAPLPPGPVDHGFGVGARDAGAEALPPVGVDLGADEEREAPAEEDPARVPRLAARGRVLHRVDLDRRRRRGFSRHGDEGRMGRLASRGHAFDRRDRAFDAVRGDERAFDRLALRGIEAPMSFRVDRVGVLVAGEELAAFAPAEAEVGFDDVAVLDLKADPEPDRAHPRPRPFDRHDAFRAGARGGGEHQHTGRRGERHQAAGPGSQERHAQRSPPPSTARRALS